MMASAIVSRWETRRDEWRQFSAVVDGVTVCDEVLEDLRTLEEAEAHAVLNLTQAAELSGYSREHLGRLVRDGQLPNAGRPNAPRVWRRDLPLKPGYLPPGTSPGELSATSKRQVVRSIVGRREETTR